MTTGCRTSVRTNHLETADKYRVTQKIIFVLFVVKQKMYKAILLIGPTGSGKTPLGKHLEKYGLNDKKCFHFDFGANLREILNTKAQRTQSYNSTANEINFIKNVLKTGALLEDKDFPLAWKIMDQFIQRQEITDKDLIVLNGLPRHIDQAKTMAEFIDINMVVHLTTTLKVIRERIRTNAGGDRAGRADDNIESIRKKIAIFNTRTAPLLDYYRGKGISVIDVHTDINTTISEVWQRVNNQH